jgi:dTDP-4-dehydrorhamnose reductase
MVQQAHCNIEVWGTYHYCGAEVTTWKGFAEAILAAAKKHPNTRATAIEAVMSANFLALAARPPYSVLDCKKIQSVFGICQRPWRSGLVQAINHLLEPNKK